MMSPDQFEAYFLGECLRAAYRRAHAAIPSASGKLKDELKIVIDVPGSKGRLFLSPYYAVYVHDGRSAISQPRDRPPLIWYKDGDEDPRLSGGRSPDRASDLKHLSAAEFRRDLKDGKLVVARKVAAVSGTFFFENSAGMAGLLEEIDSLADRLFSEQVKDFLGEYLNIEVG